MYVEMEGLAADGEKRDGCGKGRSISFSPFMGRRKESSEEMGL